MYILFKKSRYYRHIFVGMILSLKADQNKWVAGRLIYI